VICLPVTTCLLEMRVPPQIKSRGALKIATSHGHSLRLSSLFDVERKGSPQTLCPKNSVSFIINYKYNAGADQDY